MRTTADRYCRSCGYALAGLAAPRCPECGRPFDPARRRTTDPSPRRRLLRRWAWRLAVPPVLVGAVLGSAVGWVHHRWLADQAAGVRFIRTYDKYRGSPDLAMRVQWDLIGPPWLARLMGERAEWLYRVRSVYAVSDRGTYDVADLSEFHDLTHLELTGWPDARCGDHPFLAHMTGLRELQVNTEDLSAADLSTISRMTGLEKLVLYHCRLAAHPAGLFARLTRLTKVSLDKSDVTDADVAGLAAAAGLTELDLSHTPVTDAGVARSGVILPSLTYLTLTDTAVGDGTAAAVGRLTRLKALWLNGTRVSDQGVGRLSDQAGPWSLILTDDVGVTGAAGPALGRLSHLDVLGLAGTRFDDAGVNALAPLPNLTWFYVSRTRCGDGCLAAIGRWQRLHYLTLNNTAVTAAGLAQLGLPAHAPDYIEANGTPAARTTNSAAVGRALPHTTFELRP